MSPRRILVLSMVFPPDGVSTAQLVGDIVGDLASHGHDLTVLTAQPHYNVDAVARAEQPITWHRSRVFGTSEFRGARVVHVRMGTKSAGIIGRALQWLWFHMATFVLSLRVRADVCLAVSPPPTLAVQSAVRRMVGGPRFVYAVWESYPDLLFALGVLRPDSVPGRVARVLERWTYRRAARVMFLSPPMLAAATAHEPQLNQKGMVVPTFVDVDTFSPGARTAEFRAQWGIGEREFVVGYAGNLGPAQDLSVVFDAVRLLRDDLNVHLLICGSGTDDARLRELAEGLPAVTFTGHLPFVQMPEVYASFDVSVVSLATGVSAEALPSKVYRSMACGCPLLAIADPGSALVDLVESTGCGIAVSPSADAVAEAIRTMATSELSAWSDAGRATAVATASRPVVVNRIGRVLDDVAKAGR